MSGRGVRPGRATIVVPPNTPAFTLGGKNDAKDGREGRGKGRGKDGGNNSGKNSSVTGGGFDEQPGVPVAVLNFTCINAQGDLEPNILMATVLQSVSTLGYMTTRGMHASTFNTCLVHTNTCTRSCTCRPKCDWLPSCLAQGSLAMSSTQTHVV